MENKIEILAPAGSIDSLKAAVCAGADAVYMGGEKFGARAYAENPKEDLLLWAIDYVHLHGGKLYLTVNTLLKNKELEELYDYLLPYYCQGLDGVIVQDMGVMSLIHTLFPDLALHASTQMSITESKGALLLKQFGVERVVPARELSLEEVRQMKQECGMEIECFVHGALCYCYSGQCLLSSLIGARSGNRGQCAQPCRLDFCVDTRGPLSVLSLKDLCTIEMIPELVEAGIDSFKIEGRMKKPEYVYEVTRAYRKYVDLFLENGRKDFQVEQEDKERLLHTYQRRGYSDGYYRHQNGKEMISLKRPKALPELKLTPDSFKTQEKINGKLMLFPERHAKLSLIYGDIVIECEGEVVQTALKQPLGRDRVEKQLRKTGETAFVFETLRIEMDENIFLPLQAVNELRRDGIALLHEAVLAKYHRPAPAKTANKQKLQNEQILKEISECKIAAVVSSLEQLEAVAERKEIHRIYLDNKMGLTPGREFVSRIKSIQGQGKSVFLALPHIFRKRASKIWESHFEKIVALYDGFLVRNYEGLQWMAQAAPGKTLVADHHLYVFNHYAKETVKQMGAVSFTASLELNVKELKQLTMKDGTLVVYGYLPMMVTANCIQKTMYTCTKKDGIRTLKDRFQKEFKVRNDCAYCYNIIYNTAPLVLLGQADDVRKLSPGEIRMDFTTEDLKETQKIIKSYIDVFQYGKEAPEICKEFTKGHFKRGVK